MKNLKEKEKYARNRYASDSRPHVKPVRKIALSDHNIKLRILAVVLLLGIGIFFFIKAISSLLSVDPGYKQIEADAASDAVNAQEFVFRYNLGSSLVSKTDEDAKRNSNSESAEGDMLETEDPTIQNKVLTQIYTEVLSEDYKDYHCEESFDGVNNLYEINHHPGELLTISDNLYQAFLKLEEADNRLMYLGPAYAYYENIFYSHDDSEIVEFDPYENEELKEEYKQLAAYARDPSQINLELLGDNKVCLRLSKEYQKFADEMGYDTYIDLSWMRNAFIIDDIANVLIAKGYTHGSIQSYDGFYRNLDEDVSVNPENIFGADDTSENTENHKEISNANKVSGETSAKTVDDGSAGITGPCTVIYYHNTPWQNRELDSQHCYILQDGSVRSIYLNPEDGLCGTTPKSMLFSEEDQTCVELMLSSCKRYLEDN